VCVYFKAGFYTYTSSSSSWTCLSTFTFFGWNPETHATLYVVLKFDISENDDDEDEYTFESFSLEKQPCIRTAS